MRKCNLFSILDQVLDDSDHTHPQYVNEKDKPFLSPSWMQPELVDLNVFMREVNDYSRE